MRYFKLGMSLLAVAVLLLFGVLPSYAGTQQYRLGCLPAPASIAQSHMLPKGSKLLTASKLPTSIDWSATMPPVGDQGDEGSCLAWATTYADKTYQEQANHGWSDQTPIHQFSPAYVYNQLCGGVDGGLFFQQPLDLLCTQGADTLNDFPYNAGDFLTQPTVTQVQRASNFKSASWTMVFMAGSTSDVTPIKAALTTGPVVCGTSVYWDAGWIQSGDINKSIMSTNDQPDGGHGICLVGYDDSRQMADGKGAFKFINSWGPGWGHSGYGWISYAYALQYFFNVATVTDLDNTGNVTYNVGGQILNSSGACMSGVTLTFTQNGNGTPPSQVVTGANGIWSQYGFAEGVSYKVTPSQPGTSFTPASYNFNSIYTTPTAMNFTTASSLPTSLTVTAPVAGENWAAGNVNNVTWKYTGNINYVDIYLVQGGNSTILQEAAAGTNNQGSSEVEIPVSTACRTNYQIQVTSASNPAVSSTSADFNVIDEIDPYIPSAGQSYIAGETVFINWLDFGNFGNVNLDLLCDGQECASIVTNQSVNANYVGTYYWKVPASLTPGDNYQVKFSSVNTPQVTATTGNFSIVATLPVDTIAFLSPAGGESWAAGTCQTVYWTSGDSILDAFKIDLLQNGTLVQTLANTAPNNGSYPWLIPPGLAAGNYQIRLTDNANSDTATSNVFAVAAAATRLVTLTLSGKIPTVSVGGSTFNLSSLTLTGLDQSGNSFSLTGLTPTWTIASGASSASITGSTSLNPVAAGSGTVEATIGGVSSNILPFTVSSLSITTSSLGLATAGKSYSQAFTVSGNKGHCSYSITGAPSGLMLSSSTLKGTPLVAGSYPITIMATDTKNNTCAMYYTLLVVSPVLELSPGTLSAAVAEKSYSKTFTASGGKAPYRYFDSDNGTLVKGLAFNATGNILKGTPLAAGTCSVTIAVYDANDFSCSGNYTLVVNPPTIKLSPAALPSLTVGKACNKKFTATGGKCSYAYFETGSLPAGIALDENTGVLSGTPTASGSFPISVTVYDSNNFYTTKSYTLTVMG